MTSRLIRLLTCCAILIAFFNQRSAVAADVPAQSLQDQVAVLKRENDALKRENQVLRALLADTPTKPAVSQPSKAAPIVSPTQAEAIAAYWISSTGKRHNARCRYYQTSKGRSCTANEGIACKICGG